MISVFVFEGTWCLLFLLDQLPLNLPTTSHRGRKISGKITDYVLFSIVDLKWFCVFCLVSLSCNNFPSCNSPCWNCTMYLLHYLEFRSKNHACPYSEWRGVLCWIGTRVFVEYTDFEASVPTYQITCFFKNHFNTMLPHMCKYPNVSLSFKISV
jgi:hypothetical protein